MENYNNPPLKQTPPKNTTKSKTRIYAPIPHFLVIQTKFCYISGSPKPLIGNKESKLNERTLLYQD